MTGPSAATLDNPHAVILCQCRHQIETHSAEFGCDDTDCDCANARKVTWYRCPDCGELFRPHQALTGHRKKDHPPGNAVDHPAHYGGADDPYEAIKVIRAWALGFCLGNTIKYICRAGRKDSARELEDLRKARWYLDEEIHQREAAL